MPDEQEIKELHRRRRISMQNMRRSSIILGVTASVLLVLQYWLTMRLWMPFAVLAVVALTAVSDVFTYFRCGQQIRRLENERAA